MGWASGSTVFSEVISAVKEHVKEKDVRKAIYIPIIEAFEEKDWDTQDECIGEDDAYDEAIMELHPRWFEDEDEAA